MQNYYLREKMKTNLNMHLSTHQNKHKTIKPDRNLKLKTLPYSLHGDTQSLAKDIKML